MRSVEDDGSQTENKSNETLLVANDERTLKQEPTEPVAQSEKESTNEVATQIEITTTSQKNKNNPSVIQDSENVEISIETYHPANERAIISTNTMENSNQKDLANFHLLFQIGLMLFILSVLLFAMSWFAASFGMMILCLIAADCAILAVWIISFVLINMGKKIEKTDRDKRFKIEYGLAWFTACAGPLVGLGIIILGFLIVLNHF